ncbi:MAG: sigma 54-interacting transcriptional regulator [Candidatus Electryoneaceae bacterium]|nr:sigma 54-interacting transcriptional regulator [Candidatus Electryoneaceae bacterium]
MNDPRQLSRDSLELLVEAAQALLEESDLDQLLPRLLDKAFEVSGAERGYILMRDDRGELIPSVARGIEPGSLPPGDPSWSVIETALKERRPVLSSNVSRDPRFGGSESLIIRGIRSTCCIPFEARGSRLGAFYLDATGVGRLTEKELPLLEAFGSLAGLALARTMELDDTRKALKAAAGTSRFPGFIGDSDVMRRLFDRLERIAAADLPVFISGESGTGKELVARAIHQIGSRKDGPFRAIFCGNLTADLLESELFGYKKGAFTGAVADKPGLLDMADGGILFLDEIADVPATIQAKLLRFVQDGDYQRLGDPTSRHADVRVLSATNKVLSKEIESGRFREDLYYRLNVLTIELPPLRDREGDIPLLAGAILVKVATRTGQPPRRISHGALDKLSHYQWPGNVRELENVLARAAVLAAGDIIEPEDLDIDEQKKSIVLPNDPEQLYLESAVKNHILHVLKTTSGNRSEAARLLRVSRRYLQKSLAKWREEE